MREELLIKRIQELATELKQKHKYTSLKIIQQLKEEQIPITVFATTHSPLQSIVSYLTQQGMSKKVIAEKIHRNYRAIWGAQITNKIIPRETTYYIPLSIFNKKYSILESVVTYLKEVQQLKFTEIARILQKDQRTIWTVYSRAKKKNKK